MIELSPASVAAQLEHPDMSAPTAALIAFSGGLDSTALLHLLARATTSIELRAVHINHQLHPDADRWQRHCEAVSAELGIPFLQRVVHIEANPLQGIESAARVVRYEALRELLRPGELLLTAHHADDQLETVLLALMRGSGVDGLAAMPRCQRFGPGWHVRPLLDVSRAALRTWAMGHRLSWLEDPSNVNTRFDRNYLRREVVPLLRARWPSVEHAAVRTARHLAEASELLDASAAREFALARVGPCLRVSTLRSLEPAHRRNVLRYWLRSQGARMPSTRKLAALEHDMLAAQPDRCPCTAWDEVEVRRHRDLLYCMPRVAAPAAAVHWLRQQPLELGKRMGRLRAENVHGEGLAQSRLPATLSVRYRAGGESLRPAGRPHHRTVKNLLQEAGILPWWRDRLPLVFAGEQLVAIADLWIAEAYAADVDEPGVRIVWEERPLIERTVEENA